MLVVAIVALAAVIVLRRGSGATGEPGDEGPGWVLVDGWSWAMRGDRELEVLVDGDVVEATWEPVTEEDLAQVLELNPDAVTQLAARVATADPSLECGAGGCSTSGGPLELSEIIAPDHPVLAAAGVTHGAYAARVGSQRALTMEVRVAGAERGARLNLRPDLGPPEDEREPNAVVVPGGEELTVPPPGAIGEELEEDDITAIAERLGVDPSALDEPVDPGTGPAPKSPFGDIGGTAPDTPLPEVDPALPGGPGRQGDPADPSAATGGDPAVSVRGAVAYAAGEDPAGESDDEAGPREPLPPVLVAGLAWGEMFTLDVPWLSGFEFPSTGAFGAPRDQLAAAEDGSVPADTPAPFTKGLAVDDPAAGELTESQLTAWSSPLIGCGIGVVCAPGDDGVEITENAPAALENACYSATPPSSLELQSVDGDDGVELQATTPVKVLLRDRTFRFDGAARTQLGAWPEDADTPANSYWPVPVPAHEEPFALQVRSAEVYDGDGLVTVVGTQSLDARDSAWDLAALFASGAGQVLRACG